MAPPRKGKGPGAGPPSAKVFDRVARWARKNTPCKQKPLDGKMVDYFAGARIVETLMTSPFAKRQGGEFFMSEIDAIMFCEQYVKNGMGKK